MSKVNSTFNCLGPVDGRLFVGPSKYPAAATTWVERCEPHKHRLKSANPNSPTSSLPQKNIIVPESIPKEFSRILGRVLKQKSKEYRNKTIFSDKHLYSSKQLQLDVNQFSGINPLTIPPAVTFGASVWFEWGLPQSGIVKRSPNEVHNWQQKVVKSTTSNYKGLRDEGLQFFSWPKSLPSKMKLVMLPNLLGILTGAQNYMLQPLSCFFQISQISFLKSLISSIFRWCIKSYILLSFLWKVSIVSY